MLKLNKEDEIIVFRSAAIGDFLVIIPFINYLLNIVCIPEDKINFVIINKDNFNPLSLIFDINSKLFKNSIVLNPNNILAEIQKVRLKYSSKKFSKIVYLPFVNEPNILKLRKIIIFKLIGGLGKKVYGLSLNKKVSKVGTQYLSYFEKLGLFEYNKYLNFNIIDLLTFNDLETIKVQDVVINNNNKKIALYINSKLKMKIWNRNEYFNVVNYLYKNYDVDLYLIGGSEDVEYNNEFIKDFKFYKIVNLAGKLSVRESFLFFNKIDLLIANDGAPIHIAAYSNCAILGLYTYKEEVGSWEPFISKKFISVRKDVICKHCYLEYCQNTICLQTLKSKDITTLIDNTLIYNTVKQSVIIYE